MKLLIDSFEAKIENSKNYYFDTLLFEKCEANSLITTQYFKYILANFAKEKFKSEIKRLDISNIYFKITVKEDTDPKLLEEIQIKYKYLIELIDNKKKKWRKEHQEYYRLQPCLTSSLEYNEIFKSINFEVETLEEAIQGYKSANETLKLITNKSLDQYCLESKLMLNNEYKEIYQEAMIEIEKEFQSDLIIMNDEIIKLPKILINKTRLSLDRNKSINDNLVRNLTLKIINKFI